MCKLYNLCVTYWILEINIMIFISTSYQTIEIHFIVWLAIIHQLRITMRMAIIYWLQKQYLRLLVSKNTTIKPHIFAHSAIKFYLLVSTTIETIFVSILVHRLLLPILRKKENIRKNPKPPQAKRGVADNRTLTPLGGHELLHTVLGDMAKKHGPIFTIKHGVHWALVVSDATISKDCFTTNDKAFTSR